MIMTRLTLRAVGNAPGLVSTGEELLQHGGDGLGGNVVRLFLQGAVLRIGDDV